MIQNTVVPMIPLRDDNPTEIKPVMTIGFLVACVVVFLNQVTLGQHERAGICVYQYGAIPAVVFGYADLPVELAAGVALWQSGHQHVSSRRLDAPDREYAVLVDLREQH